MMKQKEKLNVELLSVAIRQAVSDLISCERSSRYKVDMGVYHAPGDEACHVCLAGAVIASRLGCDHENHSGPGKFPREQKMLYAIDSARDGELLAAGTWLDISEEKMAKLTSLKESSPHLLRLLGYCHSDSPTKFKRALLGLADELEAIGL